MDTSAKNGNDSQNNSPPPIPSSEEQRVEIDSFIRRNETCTIVAVQGLGFVGTVMAIVCANSPANHAVIGVEQNSPKSREKIHAINTGTLPISTSDPKVSKFYNAARANKLLHATSSPYAYSVADVIIVDINLDVQKHKKEKNSSTHFSVDLEPFTQAIETVAKHCREDALIVVETTVPPGTCERVVWPTLTKCLAARGLRTDRLRLGHSYERVMPGPQYIDSIREFPRVYAGIDSASADATEAFLNSIINTAKCPLTRLHSTTASEMAKVLENSYRAMNIAFMVEWTRFAEEAGVDVYAVIDAIRKRPTHANIMAPGLGVGGYCLTKDPLLASWSRTTFFNGSEPLEISVQAVEINDGMPNLAFTFIKKFFPNFDGKRVLLLGASYRGDVGDTRFSPVDGFYDALHTANAKVTVHDPFVTYWHEKAVTTYQQLSEAFAAPPDLVVICTAHSQYRSIETTSTLLTLSPCTIVDTVGALTAIQIHELATKHVVKILGRGDL